MITLNIDKGDCKNVAELIELYLPQACKDFYDAADLHALPAEGKNE